MPKNGKIFPSEEAANSGKVHKCIIFRAIACLNIIALQLSICDVSLNLLGNSILVRLEVWWVAAVQAWLGEQALAVA